MSANPTVINDALRLLRLYYGASQKELAKTLGVSQSIISEVESGIKKPSLDLLEKYSNGLNIKLSQLIFFAESVAENPAETRGKLIISGAIIKILDGLAPREKISDAAS